LPPGPLHLPSFTAWPVTWLDDATVFLHRDAVPDPFAAGLTLGPASDFQDLEQFLLGSDVPDPTATTTARQPTASPPRLSAAGEATVRQTANGPDLTARGLVCFADRRRSISATLRSVTCPEVRPRPAEAPPPTPPAPWDRWLVSNFAPSSNRAPGGKPVWFTLREQCEVLFETIFGSTSARPAHGLVVLTGATNSAKTKIAQGLIDIYLNALLAQGPRRRPHLVTFEDPIETYYIGPADPDKLDPAALKSGARRALALWGSAPERQDQLHALLRRLPRVLLAQWRGIDYTPREKGKDVRDLPQAFSDALRQTPSVFFVGEVRDPADWAAVLEFAGTGHLVVTTAHAGSLLEAMIKILSAVGADTPADRRRYASRLRAVVHLRAELGDPGAAPGTLAERSLLLPAVWRNTEPGLAALSVNGYGSLVPERRPTASSLGRRWFADELMRRATGAGGFPIPGPVQSALRERATRFDLQGE
jgi:hypothetical protein